MKKTYSEFNEVEKTAIQKVNEGWFIAEMSDDYSVTRQEQRALLKDFNEKFGYEFTSFIPNFYGEIEKTSFIGK